MSSTRLLLALVVSLAVVTLSACGGGSKSTPAPGSGTSSGSSSQPASGGVIQIGAAISMQGEFEKEGKLTRDGYDFWADWVNSHGGVTVGGKKYTVNIKYYDDQSKPDTAAKLTDKLITEDKINLILGPYGTGNTFASSAISEKDGALMINTEGAAKSIFSRSFKNLVGTMPLAGDYYSGFIHYLKTLNPQPKTFVILYANDSFSSEVAQGTKAQLEQAGYQVVYFQDYPAYAKDVSSLLTQAKAKSPDVVIGAAHLAESILITRQAREQNFNAKLWIHTVGPATPDFIKTLGKDAEYVMGAAIWTPDLKFTDKLFGDVAGFVKAFQAAKGYLPDYHVAGAVSGAETLMLGIDKAQSLDPAKIRAALAAGEFETIWGKFHYAPDGHIEGLEPAVIQIQNGQHVTVWPAVAPAKYPAPDWDKR